MQLYLKEHPVARVLVLYTHPTDPAAFDAHYTTIHIPLVHALPGLTKFEVASPVAARTGPSPYHLIATLDFPDMDLLKTTPSLPAGQATAADAAKIMPPGSQIIISDPLPA
jgi:uncharacterized protein (TIGR02118 family)